MNDATQMTEAAWQDIATADRSRLFANSERVLLYTSDGRVTQASAFFLDGGAFVWSCAYGANVSDPRQPAEYLPFVATHWMPLPSPPKGDA